MLNRLPRDREAPADIEMVTFHTSSSQPDQKRSQGRSALGGNANAKSSVCRLKLGL